MGYPAYPRGKFGDCSGATENAGPDNDGADIDGPSNSWGWTLTDLTMTDHKQTIKDA